MSEAVVDDIVAVLPPLLQTLGVVGYVRHLAVTDAAQTQVGQGTHP